MDSLPNNMAVMGGGYVMMKRSLAWESLAVHAQAL